MMAMLARKDDKGNRKRIARLTRGLAVLLCLALALPLGGCGKKPPSVDPPENADTHGFPRIYPDPATDPTP